MNRQHNDTDTIASISTAPAMEQHDFSEHDRSLLARIFFPAHTKTLLLDSETLAVPDDSHCSDTVLISAANPLPHECLLCRAGGLIWFSDKSAYLPGYYRRRFDYINNPDGSIRWIYPTGSLKPLFLELYNGSGWRGFLFRTFFRAAWRLGLQKRVRSGTFSLFVRSPQLLEELIQHTSAGSFAVFTGTPGENRKAVFVLEKKNSEKWYFKLPLSAAARRLVRNEYQTLHKIGKHDFKALQIPEAALIRDGVLLSNIKPRRYSSAASLQEVHLKALAELNRRDVERMPLPTLDAWEETEQNLVRAEQSVVCNDLPETLVRDTIGLLRRLQHTLAGAGEVPVSLAHGDFTPWNMYSAPASLHLYDWELSCRLPLLYDLFHFEFQSAILIRHQSFPSIRENIGRLESRETVREILMNNQADFRLLYRFYLLRNTAYYLARYMQQDPLHRQAHWLLKAWHAALREEV